MEKTIEIRLKREVEKLGGMCLKFVSPGMNAVPDRLVLMPAGRLYFVELKDTGKKPTPLQLVVHKMLFKLGFQVWVIDSVDAIKVFISQIK